MRILIACDGSEIGESAVAVVASWGQAASDVCFVTVLDPTDLHGVNRSVHSPAFFMGAPTARGAVLPSPGRGTVSPEDPDIVAEDQSPGTPIQSGVAEDKTQAIERARSEHFDYLRAIAGHYFAGREIPIEIAFSDEPAEAIADYAVECGANVIAVGSHGRSGISRALMGSVAEKLVRDGPLPVLVVGPTAREQLPTAEVAP